MRQIEGIVWFVSLLTRVDGLVLLTPDFRVIGFGVEIRVGHEPDAVALAGDATLASVSELDPTRYGTRHRSMMRYSAQHPGRMGFVISQDGAVHGLTRVGDATVMWDNVKIQQYPLPEGEHDPGGHMTSATPPRVLSDMAGSQDWSPDEPSRGRSAARR